jgi:hypothetical protein
LFYYVFCKRRFTLKKIRLNGKHLRSPALFLLLMTAMIVTGCSGALPAVARPAPIATATSSEPSVVNNAPSDTPAPGAASVPQVSNGNPNPKCDALFLANYDMGMALAVMVNLTANTDYTAYTSPGSPFYLDFKKLRSELDTLATLPDPSAADALIVGKPSEAITYFHQLADMAETDINNQGKPFVDTSPSGVKLIGIDTPWEQHAAVFGVAMGNVCQNYTAPSDLFAGTPVATVDPQLVKQNDSLMATAAAAASGMLATLNAAETAYPEPTETPIP